MDPPIPYYMIPEERMQNGPCSSSIEADPTTVLEGLNQERAAAESAGTTVLHRLLSLPIRWLRFHGQGE